MCCQISYKQHLAHTEPQWGVLLLKHEFPSKHFDMLISFSVHPSVHSTPNLNFNNRTDGRINKWTDRITNQDIKMLACIKSYFQNQIQPRSKRLFWCLINVLWNAWPLKNIPLSKSVMVYDFNRNYIHCLLTNLISYHWLKENNGAKLKCVRQPLDPIVFETNNYM